jgi:hypothetical protein
VILVDWSENGRLVILNDDGTLDKVIPCSLGHPFDVTYLDDRTVAVSTSKGIKIINISLRITSLPFSLQSTNITLPFGKAMHPAIYVSFFPFGISNLLCKVTAIKEYASDLQIFLGSKTIEEEVKKEERYIMALSEDGCLQKLNLKYRIGEQIKGIILLRKLF